MPKKSRTSARPPARRPRPPASIAQAAPGGDRRVAELGRASAAFDRHLEGAKSADDALELLSRLFGGLPYVRNEEWAADGTSFRVRAVEYQPGQGYKGADRWNLAVVSQFGEAKALTMGENATRNAFMQGLSKVVDRFGETPPLRLQAVPFTDKESGDELTFYALVLERDWKAPEGAAETLEGAAV